MSVCEREVVMCVECVCHVSMYVCVWGSVGVWVCGFVGCVECVGCVGCV
jgi:hypothetical protein